MTDWLKMILSAVGGASLSIVGGIYYLGGMNERITSVSNRVELLEGKVQAQSAPVRDHVKEQCAELAAAAAKTSSPIERDPISESMLSLGCHHL